MGMPFQVQEGEAFEPGSSSRQGTTNQAGSALNRRGFGEGASRCAAARADLKASVAIKAGANTHAPIVGQVLAGAWHWRASLTQLRARAMRNL
jgi:hypothetical protein